MMKRKMIINVESRDLILSICGAQRPYQMCRFMCRPILTIDGKGGNQKSELRRQQSGEPPTR